MSGSDGGSAHDGTLGDGSSAETERAFRASLDQTLGAQLLILRSMGNLQAPALRDAIRDMCVAARAQGIPSERVIIQVKEVWADLPATRDMFRTGGISNLLGRVVTMTLDEYYRVPAPPA